MIRKYFLLFAISVCTLNGFAQKSYNEQVQEYIAQFKELAIQEQQRTGIPASITLAQGIFETGAGSSELCTNASNHFGIKCKNTWNGETYTYTDDAKDECFRKYNSAKHSYIDHSNFLKDNKRYSPLFSLSPTDYAAWAYGLKRCGYATNPQYAKKLIKTIEDFKLQEFTYAALDNSQDEVLLASAADDVPMPRNKMTTAAVTAGEHIPDNDGYLAQQKQTRNNNVADVADELYVEKATTQEAKSNSNVTEYYQTTSRNNLKGFYARKGDMLLEYAIKNKIRYAKLLELNDIPDAPLEADMFVYLERKAKTGQTATHTVENGESLIQISQHEGIQLQQLRLLNHLNKGEEPVAGTVLHLQSTAEGKPELYAAGTTDKSSNREMQRRASNDEGFVPAGKKNNEPVATVQQQETEEDIPTTAANRNVNIANERPVEEEIAEERSKKAAPVKDESKMTALEKLKAHMDKTVYAERDYQPKQSGHYDEAADSEEAEAVTTPARRNTVAKYTPSAEERKATDKKKKETLKPKAKAKAKSHTVRKGESLFEIAQKYDLSVSQLQKMNKLSGGKKIQPGMKLKVVK